LGDDAEMRRDPPGRWDNTTGRVRGTTREIEAAARDLRRRMTPAERILWNELRANRLAGLSFRRQHPLGPFVVDFACPTRKLIVEVDGDVHLDRVEQDAARTTLLATYDWEIVRFRNEAVLTDLPAVLREIRAIAEARPIAPGRRGRGAAEGRDPDSATAGRDATNALPSPTLGPGTLWVAAGGEGPTEQKGHQP
jgi:very-short-patch-repair endonuclease